MRKIFEDGEAVALAAAVAANRKVIQGTTGDDQLEGNGKGNIFNLQEGGDDVVHGRGGNDLFLFEDSFTSEDHVDGGTGGDKVILFGKYRGEIEILPEQLRDIERVRLVDSEYNLVIGDGFDRLKIDTSPTYDAKSLHIDASALSSGSVKVSGSNYDDVITGESCDDWLLGRGGSDVLTGGGGSDEFRYFSIFESRPSQYASPDYITDFTNDDVITLFTNSRVPSYHIGETDDRVGDVVISFNEASNTTSVLIFTDSDDRVDMEIQLKGAFAAFSVVNDFHLICF